MANGKQTKILAESYPMVGGDGDYSYANNSRYQRGVVDATKKLINEAISNKLDLEILEIDPSKHTFQIADFGCSVGPNTFLSVQNILEAVELKLQQAADEHKNHSATEFQVFFNDLYGNDFNTLFKNLPQSRRYFASGVPGSFHGRLFPKSSLHFVHSSYTLHWLSKVPKEIVDCSTSRTIGSRRLVKEVAGQAYSAQFENDFESFLNARAQELVPGGLMAMVLFAVPDGIPFSETAPAALYDVLESCLLDLAKMGVISEESVESFHLPVYNATTKELEALMQRNGHFTIEKMEKLSHPVRQRTLSAKDFSSDIRAVFGEMIKAHFRDESVTDQILTYLTNKISENFLIFQKQVDNMNDLFILLKRRHPIR